VITGEGKMIIIAVGKHSALGKIENLLLNNEIMTPL